jgi:hypothetical protein
MTVGTEESCENGIAVLKWGSDGLAGLGIPDARGVIK